MGRCGNNVIVPKPLSNDALIPIAHCGFFAYTLAHCYAQPKMLYIVFRVIKLQEVCCNMVPCAIYASKVARSDKPFELLVR